MRVLAAVDLVGSGVLGFSLSHAEDSHVYLIHSGDEAVLIDAGCGLGKDRILGHIDAAGVPRSRVGRIFVTHAHADHSAGALGLSRALDAEVRASADVAAILRSGDEEAAGLVAGRRSGAYPADVRLRPTPVADVADGAAFTIGGLVLTAHAMPGHAVGHLCFSVHLDGRLAVFTGDLIFSRGRVAVLATHDTDVAALGASIRALAAMGPDLLLPGHGAVVLSDVQNHLEPALRRLDGEELPPPFLV